MGRTRFKVTITETLKRMVEVEADDMYEAELTVSDGWHNSEYILDAEDFVGVAFEAVPVLSNAIVFERRAGEGEESIS
ncbi:MAG: hypothetical protein HFF39_00040 [Lawsonibacter sp.]|nr:hypothetical protein [Lawsonibacter sp.]